MSQKSTKRSRKRTEDENLEFSTPLDNSKSAKDNSLDNSKKSPDDVSELKGFPEVSKNGNVDLKEFFKSENIIAEDKRNFENKNSSQKNTENSEQNNTESKIEEKNTDHNNFKENDLENVSNSSELNQNEMEPLTQESEEVYPELVFDENSDIDSRKSSPVLSRCKTRRSQTRNIPTPKTPKSVIEQNGDEKKFEEFDQESEISAITGVSLEVEIDSEDLIAAETNLKDEICSREIDNDEIEQKENEEIKEDTDSVKKEFQSSNFTFQDVPKISDFRDCSLADTIRNISSRRAIRPMGDYRKLTFDDKEWLNLQDITGSRSSVERISGIKRKCGNEQSEKTKRSRLDTSGIFSYITKPMGHLKTHLTRSPLKSNSPKLTGYKDRDELFEKDNELSEIKLGENRDNHKEPNKWCVIM